MIFYIATLDEPGILVKACTTREEMLDQLLIYRDLKIEVLAVWTEVVS